MNWTRSDVLALARNRCAKCLGWGLRSRHSETGKPCGCVLRSIFRACLNKFRECVEMEPSVTRAKLEWSFGSSRKTAWSRKEAEYMADFLLIAKRTLTEDEHRIFRYHFLLGADWKLCCLKLKIDRGAFFHAVYRIMQKLGRRYSEIEPFALFPLDEYFCGTTRVTPIQRPPSTPPGGDLSERVPLRRVA